MNEKTPSAIDRFATNLSAIDEVQVGITRGDPQVAALAQYLGPKNFSETDILVDFGSGAGVVAEVLAEARDGLDLPRYWAVDLPTPLTKLSLPPRVHNNSQKFTVDEFVEQQLSKRGSAISVVVIRNVLHHLSLREFAKTLAALNQHLGPTSEIYLQDMGIVQERQNAGWDGRLLTKALVELGMQCRRVGLESYSGTPWFALLISPNKARTDQDYIAEILINARRAQLEEVSSGIDELNKKAQANDTHQLLVLTNAHSNIVMDLRRAGCTIDLPKASPTLAGIGIPIVEPEYDGKVDFAVVVTDEIFRTTGLRAILSKKAFLDFPGLMHSCTAGLSFAGYSIRSLFKRRNWPVLRDLVLAGRQVRVVVADPEGPATRLRAAESVYAEPDALRRDILSTIEAARKFRSDIAATTADASVHRGLVLRISARVPACSYFIKDDSCFVSLYSPNMTGSTGPCLVFQRLPSVLGYYEVLHRDFEDLFSTARDIDWEAS